MASRCLSPCVMWWPARAAVLSVFMAWPGKTEPVAKLAYVQGFAPWGWMVGTGLYLDDLNTQFERDALWFLARSCCLAPCWAGWCC